MNETRDINPAVEAALDRAARELAAVAQALAKIETLLSFIASAVAK